MHFLAACNALQADHQSLLSHDPLDLPDPAHDPISLVLRLSALRPVGKLEREKRKEGLVNGH